MGRVLQRHPVLSVTGGRVSRRPDAVAVEEPLEIRLDGSAWQVTMRTPGDDIDLVHGLLCAEQVISDRRQIVLARYCDGAGPDGLNTYNVLDVSLSEQADPNAAQRRAVVTTSACGICGTASIDAVRRQARFPLDPDVRFDAELLQRAPDLLRERQRTFERTGGLHAAGLLTSGGELLVVREDVGRHNAVDKVIGWAVREDRLPLASVALVVSGRASFELTQKAVLAGIGVLVAVSAPSSLAVQLAAETGCTLIGFARGDRMNVYTGIERVRLPVVETGRSGPDR